MKQLTKVNIKEFVEMTNKEMKSIIGGTSGGASTTTTTSSGSYPTTSGGYRLI